MVRRDQLTKISGGKEDFTRYDWFRFFGEIISFHMLIFGFAGHRIGFDSV